jgi:hypothetical protein
VHVHTRQSNAALPHALAQVGGPPEGGEDEDPAVGKLLAQPRRGFDAVHPRHLDVEQGDVGPGLQGGGNDLVAGGDLGDHLEVGLEGQQCGERAAHHMLVLGQ